MFSATSVSKGMSRLDLEFNIKPILSNDSLILSISVPREEFKAALLISFALSAVADPNMTESSSKI